MHVLFLTPGFANDVHDTTCIPPMQDLALALREQYPDVNLSIMSLHYPFERGKRLWNEIPVYCMGGNNTKLFKIILWLRVLWQIYTIHQIEPVSIIHAFWLSETTLLAQWSAWLYKIPYLTTIMGQDALPHNRYLPLLRLRSRNMVTLSQSASRTIQQTIGITPEHQIPFGLPRQCNVLTINRDIDILGVGSITPVKNYRLFLNIVAELYTVFPTIRAAIVGNIVDQHEYNHLCALLQQHGLQSSVQFFGEVKRTEVFRFMNKSKILLHTAPYEGQGMALIEAFAHHTTVVCFDVGFTLPGMYICPDSATMIQVILQQLQYGKGSPKPLYEQTIPSIEQTARAYYSLYQTLIIHT